MTIAFFILITILIVTLAIWAISKKKRQEISNMKIKSQEDKVFIKAEKLEQKTNTIGIPELIGQLYHDYIKNLPGWIKDNKPYLSSLITDVVDLGKEYDTELIKTKINFFLKGNSYIFSFNEHNVNTLDGSWQVRGDLQLFLNDNKILALSMVKDYSKEGSKWRPICIEMFIEGDWVEDFQELERRIALSKQ